MCGHLLNQDEAIWSTLTHLLGIPETTPIYIVVQGIGATYCADIR